MADGFEVAEPLEVGAGLPACLRISSSLIFGLIKPDKKHIVEVN
jgi:hypothetical protein